MDNLFFEEAQRILSGPDDRPINISRFNHREIVQGLHRLVYAEGQAYKRKQLRICHPDGSESAPISIPALGVPVHVNMNDPPLRLGFVSGRHPEMDTFIDFYLVRHRELQQFASSADKEQEVYERTLRLFRDEAFAGSWWVEVYHTGLELVTAGFYRAGIDTACQRKERGLPAVSLKPLIWAPRGVNVTVLIDQARGALNPRKVTGELERLAATFAPFLEVEGLDTDRPLGLRWRLERPMWTSERDLLCRQAPVTREILSLLYKRTQYQREHIWVLG